MFNRCPLSVPLWDTVVVETRSSVGRAVGWLSAAVHSRLGGHRGQEEPAVSYQLAALTSGGSC